MCHCILVKWSLFSRRLFCSRRFFWTNHFRLDWLCEEIFHCHEHLLFHYIFLKDFVLNLLQLDVLLVFQLDFVGLVFPLLTSSRLKLLLVVIHCIFESHTPLLLGKVDLFNYLVGQEGEVHDDENKIRLLPAVSLALIRQYLCSFTGSFITDKSVLVAILNEFFSLLNMRANVVEALSVSAIRHNDVPCSALNGLPWHFGSV